MSPTLAGFLQVGLLVLALAVCWKPLGDYIARVVTTGKHWRPERPLYKVMGIDPEADQLWGSYARSVLSFAAISVLLLYGLERLQHYLLLSLGMPNVPPALAWNTATSFVTNTNWQNYSGESTMGYRPGNLTALRELALLWLADRVDEGLQRYREAHGIHGTWEARERVVVALTGGPEGETLIRRAARIAARSSGGDLLAVHVTRSDGLTGADPATLAAQRRLAESLGGSYHQVVGDDVPEALLTFARGENATQLVLGASRRSWLTALLTGPGIGFRTIRGPGDIDVHIVTHAHMGRGRGLPAARGSPRQPAAACRCAGGSPATCWPLSSCRWSLSGWRPCAGRSTSSATC